MHPTNGRESEIAKIAESKEARAKLEKHLEEIIQGAGFKGSHRSGQFLRYIVGQAVAGHFDSLKERAIGMELFGRSPSYDTGEDAIVRVTASDVRKRLLQHYGSCENPPEFRISLPLGSYVPEIVRERHNEILQDSNNASPAAHLESSSTPASAPEQVGLAPATSGIGETQSRRWPRLQWLSLALALTALGFAVFSYLLTHDPDTEAASVSVLPWSTFFTSAHPTHLITSDPDISTIQRLTGGNPISVSDYANHNYIPNDKVLSPEVRSICENMMRGDKSATIDTQIAVNIAELAKGSSRRIDVQGARNTQFSNLKTDDNFIFLGSPRTNPWVSLLNDHLDFRIVFDKDSGEEIIHNVYPASNEPADYVPTAKGGATGVSYAIIAFLQNPDQNGQVLLLAGVNAEGTQATGKLITDLPRLKATLATCGISSSTPVKHFELLLRVKTMASSPSGFDVVACRALPGSAQ